MYYVCIYLFTGMRRITTDRIYDGGPIILYYNNVNKNPTRCNNMQIFIYCKVTLHVSGVTALIIRSTKNCNRNLRYRS